MSRYQREKGKAGEREAAKLLRSFGYEARRSVQYQGVQGNDDSADLQHSIPGVRVEVKYGYDSAELGGSVVNEWVETAIAETPPDQNWIILWRKTRKKWMLILNVFGIVMMTSDIEKGIQLAGNKVS